MAAESIIGLRRPEFPKTESTESGLTTRIEYIGDTTTILAALPLLSAAWGDYPGLVKTANSHPTENTAITIAVVTTFLEIDNENTDEGELVSETFEIDWIPVERPMKEHPQFAIGEGGANALTARDIVDIDRWKAETNTPELREVYKYHDKTSAGGEFVTLSTNAKLFARGIEIGFDIFIDRAPIARRTGKYRGGPPPEGQAGLKETPAGFPNLPANYEWRKSADRATRSGNDSDWDRDQEWEGAVKVFFDSAQVYWSPPA